MERTVYELVLLVLGAGVVAAGGMLAATYVAVVIAETCTCRRPHGDVTPLRQPHDHEVAA